MPAVKNMIDLSGSYVLTPVGLNYCAHARIPIRETRSSRGLPVSAFQWPKVNAEVLEGFITNGFLEELEFRRIEFGSKRSEVGKLFGCLFDGILYRRFKFELRDRARRLLVKMAKLRLDLTPERAKQLTLEHGGKVKAFEKLVQRAVSEHARQIHGDEAQELLAHADKFLRGVDEEAWLYYAAAQTTDAKKAMLASIVELAYSYLKRAQLRELVPIMVMEFVQLAEISHFSYLAEKDHRARKQDVPMEQLLSNSSFRNRLAERAKEQNELITLSLAVQGNIAPDDPRLSLSIRVRNRGMIGGSRSPLMRDAIDEKASKAMRFADFLKELTAGNEIMGMATSYMVTLEKLCNGENILLETGVTVERRSRHTLCELKFVM